MLIRFVIILFFKPYQILEVAVLRSSVVVIRHGRFRSCSMFIILICGFARHLVCSGQLLGVQFSTK
jgi:hypothetical protein